MSGLLTPVLLKVLGPDRAAGIESDLAKAERRYLSRVEAENQRHEAEVAALVGEWTERLDAVEGRTTT